MGVSLPRSPPLGVSRRTASTARSDVKAPAVPAPLSFLGALRVPLTSPLDAVLPDSETTPSTGGNDMTRRTLTALGRYVLRSGRGRLIDWRCVGQDDYIAAVIDSRDGRTHLFHTARDTRKWFETFVLGVCERPAVGICGRCNRLHTHRDVDREILRHCMTCAGELVVLGAEMFLEEVASDGP